MRHQFSIQVHEKPPEIDIEEYMDDDDEDPEDDGFITGKDHKYYSKKCLKLFSVAYVFMVTGICYRGHHIRLKHLFHVEPH